MSTLTLKLNSLLPSFDLLGIDGILYSGDSFSQKKGLIIVFSCNHCPYVQAYENRLINIQSKYQNEIQVVAINSNDDIQYPEDSYDEMIKRAKEKEFNFKYLHDKTQEIAKKFDATHTPEIFLFNEERKLVFHGKIDDNWQDESLVKNKYLENAIKEMLAGEEISMPETFTIGCTIKWK